MPKSDDNIAQKLLHPNDQDDLPNQLAETVTDHRKVEALESLLVQELCGFSDAERLLLVLLSRIGCHLRSFRRATVSRNVSYSGAIRLIYKFYYF